MKRVSLFIKAEGQGRLERGAPVSQKSLTVKKGTHRGLLKEWRLRSDGDLRAVLTECE